MTHLNQDRLNSLSFLDYLKEMHSRIEGIRHSPKSNSAYTEARDLCNDIKYRIVKELHLTWEDWNKRNLRQSEDILDLYSHSESDKRKAARIAEFVDEYSYDLHSMIMARERHKENPDTPIEDEEV